MDDIYSKNQNQINFSSINCFSKLNSDNIEDMNLETDKNENDSSSLYKTNSAFLNLFNEENQNKFNYNMPLTYNTSNINNNNNINNEEKYRLYYKNENINNIYNKIVNENNSKSKVDLWIVLK